MDRDLDLGFDTEGRVTDPATCAPVQPRWPTPEVDRPSMDELEQAALDGVCEASDGCDVEPDGVCPHGHPSWLLRLGFI